MFISKDIALSFMFLEQNNDFFVENSSMGGWL